MNTPRLTFSLLAVGLSVVTALSGCNGMRRNNRYRGIPPTYAGPSVIIESALAPDVVSPAPAGQQDGHPEPAMTEPVAPPLTPPASQPAAQPESAPAPEPLFPPPPPALPAPVDARYLPAPETTREFAPPAQSFSLYEIWSNAFSEPIEAQQKLVPQPPPPGLFRRMGDATRDMFDRSEDQIDQPALEDDPLDRPEPAPFGHSFPMGRERAGIRNDRSHNDNYVVLGSPENPGVAMVQSKRMNDLDHRSGRPMISLPSMQALRQDAHIAVWPFGVANTANASPAANYKKTPMTSRIANSRILGPLPPQPSSYLR